MTVNKADKNSWKACDVWTPCEAICGENEKSYGHKAIENRTNKGLLKRKMESNLKPWPEVDDQ